MIKTGALMPAFAPIMSRYAPTFPAITYPEPAPRSVDVHHVERRHSGGYLDEKTWLAVSREAHDWIHANPKEARIMGFLK